MSRRRSRTYGDAVGIAFQLRDDVLGLFGDPGRTGKDRDDDLREGKRTLLVLRALRLAGPAAAPLPRGRPRRPGAHHRRRRPVPRDRGACGALASIETLLGAHTKPRRPRSSPVPEPARAALEELAALAIRREHRSGDTRVARRTIVIGAGLGGLAAACHLVGRGHDVVVVEAGDVPGGRAGRLEARRLPVRHRSDRAHDART